MSNATGFLVIVCATVLSGATVLNGERAQADQSQAPPASIASVMESQLAWLQSQFVPAAEAMPEDKYDYTPGTGNDVDFKGVRTFALQVKHVATANMGFYNMILGQPLPPGVSLAGATNGPDDIRTKPQIVQYLKDSFALGHKAIASLTLETALAPFPASPVPNMKTRLSLAAFSCSHAWDHYGQMVAYLRLNGIVPPASVGQPPANPSRK
jgi:hypothetical protein